jgi:hypothetical protein
VPADGHCAATEPRGRKYRKSAPKWDANDGRPPDTVEALAAVDKEQQKKSKKKSSKKTSTSQKEQPTTTLLQPAIVVSPLLTPQALISYEWSGGNSCFFDVGLALWFEAFSRWPQHVREALLKSLPSDTVLASVFNHFERRNKWLATGKGDLVNGRRELSLGQGMARHGIFKQLDLYETAESYGCSRTWLRRGVMVCYHRLVCFFMGLICLCFQELPDAVQTHFGIQHHLICVCPVGHKSSHPASSPDAIFSIICNDIDTTRAICGPDATFEDYLKHIIPRRLIGNDAGGTTLLHTLPLSPCSHSGCNHNSRIDHIETSWPHILNVTPETSGGSADVFNRKALPLPRYFHIQNVQYELVGRMHHDSKRQHYTCDRPILSDLYRSDDMLFNGNFIRIGSADLLRDTDFAVHMLVYHRLSDSQVSKIASSAKVTYS